MRTFLIMTCTVILGGCGTSEKYETVSVRFGDMSCSENIRIDNSGKAGLSYRSDSGGLVFNLSGPASVPGKKSEISKRCDKLLQIMNKMAESRAELEITSGKIGLERNRQELKKIEAGGDAMFEGTDF